VPLGFSSGTQAEVEVVSVLARALPPGRSQLALDLPRVSAPVLVHRLRLLLPEGASYRVRRSDLRFAPAGSLSPGYFDFDSFEEMNAGSLPAGKTTLYVKVVDEEGTPLPGATITLTGAFGARVEVTGAEGVAVLNAPGGEYSLTAELDGFPAQELFGLQLVEGRHLGTEVTLSSAVADAITIQAEPRLKQDGVRISAGGADDRDRKANAALFKEEAAGLQQGLVGGVKPLPVSIPESGKALAFSGVLPPAQITLELDVKAKGKS
jgi:Carboxypeptidase regulatory-like domain